MKPKAKLLVPQAGKETATKAIAVVVNIWDKLDKVVKDLSPADSRFVVENIHAIKSDMDVIFQKKDAISAKLVAIRVRTGDTVFASLAQDVFPRLGMSRASAYRLAESGDILRDAVPDATLRQNLIGRTEKPFTTTDKKTGKVTLRPAFIKALKAIDTSKVNAADPISVDSVASALLTKYAELGKPQKKSKEKLQAERSEHIQDLFGEYMAKYGTAQAEMLLNECEEILVTEQKTINASVEKEKTHTAAAKTA